MKVLVMASQKGGVGKTTIAAHLAVAAESAEAGPVYIMDMDPQASLAGWWNLRQAETPQFANVTLANLSPALEHLRSAGAALVIIDTPPAMTAEIAQVSALADLVLILTRPSPVDLMAIGRTVELVNNTGRPFVFAVNAVKPQARLTGQTAAVLSQHGVVAPSFISDRTDFAAAMTDGRTVGELSKKHPGASEIAELWDFVAARLSAPKTRSAAQ